jgi:hypothetical protein
MANDGGCTDRDARAGSDEPRVATSRRQASARSARESIVSPIIFRSVLTNATQPF